MCSDYCFCPSMPFLPTSFFQSSTLFLLCISWTHRQGKAWLEWELQGTGTSIQPAWSELFPRWFFTLVLTEKKSLSFGCSRHYKNANLELQIIESPKVISASPGNWSWHIKEQRGEMKQKEVWWYLSPHFHLSTKPALLLAFP